MKAISSKLNIYVKSVNVINNGIEKTILNVIMWSFGALALLYLLFLGNMVRDIVERRSLEAEARTLASDVSTLENTYLSMSNNIDLTLSYSMGFKDVKATFATRQSLGFKSSGTKVAENDL